MLPVDWAAAPWNQAANLCLNADLLTLTKAKKRDWTQTIREIPADIWLPYLQR